MKMKFLSAAFAALFLIASCMQEKAIEPTDGPGSGLTSPTTATFALSVQKTKALADFNPFLSYKTALATGTEETVVDLTNVRLLIYDAANLLEVNEPFPATASPKLTVKLKAGDKKIFLFANTNNIATTPTFDAALAGLAIGSPYSTLYNLCYDAGTPQDILTQTAKGTTGTHAAVRSFHIEPLYRGVDETPLSPTPNFYISATKGAPAGNSNAFIFRLNPSISETDSNGEAVPATAPSSGNVFSQANNSFIIDLRFFIAKAGLGHAQAALIAKAPVPNSGSPTEGNIATVSNIKYGVHNLARNTAYLQREQYNSPTSSLFMSYYWDYTATGANQTAIMADYLANFDSASNATVDSQVNATYTTNSFNVGPYVYVPENNHKDGSGITFGQASYYAVNATYLPMHVVHDVALTSTIPPALNFSIEDIGHMMFTNNNYVFLLREINGNMNGNHKIEAGTVFKDSVVLKKAVWLTRHNTGAPGASGWTASNSQKAAAEAILTENSYLLPNDAAKPLTANPPGSAAAWANYYPWPDYAFYCFEGGQSWYRVTIGETVGTEPLYGVTRGKSYNALITKFSGPGVPYEWILGKDKPDPIVQDTYVTVQIKILDWEPKWMVVDI